MFLRLLGLVAAMCLFTTSEALRADEATAAKELTKLGVKLTTDDRRP